VVRAASGATDFVSDKIQESAAKVRTYFTFAIRRQVMQSSQCSKGGQLNEIIDIGFSSEPLRHARFSPAFKHR
jgi:hypothetical protein